MHSIIYIIGLIVVVIMAMVQFDRQYTQVLQIREKQDELTRDVVAIRNQLAQGIVSVGTSPGTTTAPCGITSGCPGAGLMMLPFTRS